MCRPATSASPGSPASPARPALAIVLADRAVAVRRRPLQVQVREQVDGAIFSIEHLVEHAAARMARGQSARRRQARLFAVAAHHRRRRAAGESLRGSRREARSPSTDNPIDAIWTDRPPPPLGAVVLHDLRYAGESARDKLARVRARDRRRLRPTRCVVSDPHAVAWAVQHPRQRRRAHAGRRSPSRMVPREGRPTLYIDGRKLGNDVRHRARRDCRRARERGASSATSPRSAASGARCGSIRPPPPRRSRASSPSSGGTVLRGADPIAPMKAVKNAAEIAGARAAHLRDGAAVARFLAWFDREAPAGRLTEIDAVEALESFRRDTGLLKDVSFPTIAGAGAERRHRALPRHPAQQPQHRAGRTLSGRFRRAVRGRHHRHHPHHRGRRAERRDARPFHPRAQGPYRDRPRGVSRRHHRRAARFVRAAISLAGRARFRPRHRPRRRQLSLGARRAGAHLQARQRARSSAA